MLSDDARLAALCDENVVLSLCEENPNADLATSVFVWLVVDVYECYEASSTD